MSKPLIPVTPVPHEIELEAPPAYRNYYANIKGRVESVRGNGVHYYGKPSDKTLELARTIFGIEYAQNHFPNTVTRMSASMRAVRTYNFMRQPVTQVEHSGMRSCMENIPVAMFEDINSGSRYCVDNGLSRGTYAGNQEQLQNDLFGLRTLILDMGVKVTGCVVIVQLIRLVATNMAELRTSIRSLALSDAMIRNIETDFDTPVPSGNGIRGYYRDLLLVSLVHEDDLAKHKTVLDQWSGVQLSFEGIERAPGYVFDTRADVLDNPFIGDKLRVSEDSMASYIINYHHSDPGPHFFNDMGISVPIPRKRDRNFRAGFTKRWHAFDQEGNIKIYEHYVPLTDMTEERGFYRTSSAAYARGNRRQLREHFNVAMEQMSKVALNVLGTLDETSRNLRAGTVEVVNSISKKHIEVIKQDIGLSETNRKMAEEIEGLKAELKEERKKDGNYWNSVIRNTGALVGAVVSAFGLFFKSKKKAA